MHYPQEEFSMWRNNIRRTSIIIELNSRSSVWNSRKVLCTRYDNIQGVRILDDETWVQPDAEKMSISACRGNWRQPSFSLLFFSPYTAAAAVANNATDRRKSRKRPWHMAFVASRMQQPPQSVAQLSSFFHVLLLRTSLCGREKREKKKREKDSFANVYYEEEEENLLPSRTLRVLYSPPLTWHTFH